MSTLYELSDELEMLREMCEDPDISPEVLADTMEAVEGELEVKAEGYAKVMKELDGQADILSREIERLQAKKRSIEGNSKRMKERLQDVMERNGKMKFKTDLFSFSVQNNPPSLKIDNPMEIPGRYLIPQPPKVDNVQIKADMKAGEQFDWCHLEQTRSLSIR